jgi:LysR family transcriptional regulator, carnitine catabolism transcriptional activator
VTQSAASLSLRQLEQSLGVRLFERSTRALRPTEAARNALPLAERALQDVERLVSTMGNLAGLQEGRLRIAATPSIAANILPALVSQFRALHPGVVLELDDCPPEQLLARLHAETADLAIGTPDRPTSEIVTEVLARDAMCVICPLGDPLLTMRRLTWATLRDRPLITVRSGDGIRRLFDDAVSRLGFELRPAFEVRLLNTALAMTAQGLGVAVLPGLLVAHSAYAGLATRKLTQPVVQRSIVMAHLAGRPPSPAVVAFSGLVREAFKAL